MSDKNLPSGWGNNEDDDNEYSPWSEKKSVPDKKKSENKISLTKDSNENKPVFSEPEKTEPNVNPAPASQTSDFSQYHPEKKSNATPILIAVIALLLVAVGVLAGIMLMNNQKSKDNPLNNSVSESENRETTTESEKLQTEETEVMALVTETTVISTSITETTTKQTAAPAIKADPIKTQAPKKEVVLSYKESYKKLINEKINLNTDSNFSVSYTLFDMDYDGTPELLLRTGTCEADSLISVYTYKNNEYSQVADNLPGSHTGFAFDYIANQMVLCQAHMGVISLAWYDIDGNGNLRFLIDTSDSIDDYAAFMKSYNVSDYPFASYSRYSNTTYVYYDVENYEYTDSLKYSGIDFRFIDNYDSLKKQIDNQMANATPAPQYTPPKETYAFQGVINTESSELNVREKPSTDSAVLGKLPKGTSVSVYYIEGYSDWYKIDCSQYGLSGYVSAQYVVDSDYYNQTNSYYAGQVVTENDPLNLRDAPSSSGNVIIKIPKGAYVDVWSSSGDWYYVSYTENGTVYYGYASSQFIKIL